MSEKLDKILEFLYIYEPKELKDYMKFAMGAYIFVSIVFSPIPYSVLGPKNPLMFVFLGLFWLPCVMFAIWYHIVKKRLEIALSNAYLYIGVVLGSATIVSFVSSAIIFVVPDISFGVIHIVANAVGILLNLILFVIRIVQYKYNIKHEVRIVGGARIMPLVLLGIYLLNSTDKYIDRRISGSLLTMLMGYIVMCFSAIFLTNLYVALKHNIDQYYIATHLPTSKKGK